MATGWIYLNFLQSRGVFLDGKARLLDVGCQHIFDVPVEEGMAFCKANGYVKSDAELASKIQYINKNSKWPNWRVYLHELIALSSLDYISYDIFEGPFTQIFDLNSDDLPAEHVGAFDVVLNFGTTEHVFNQYNAFRVIHDATKVDGYMFHQVPTAGYVNHGYWTYSPRTFFDLAEANGYKVECAWVTGPQGATVFAEKFEGLTWDNALPENNHLEWQRNPLPNGLINVLMRKTRDDDFRLSLDVSTTAAPTNARFAQAYKGPEKASVSAVHKASGLARALRNWIAKRR